MSETAFAFIPRAHRPAKSRRKGITEIRGPYYSAYGPRHLADILETVGAWVDGIKFAGGSFALSPPDAVKAINKPAHDHDAYVSTGGWIENVLRFGPEAIDRYLAEAKSLGFDVIEISTGFVSLPVDAVVGLLGQRGQPVRRPQPDRPARSFALRHPGHEGHVGPRAQHCELS
jgi:phosphosulfolactate synthase (CoM biosynthesis protein A)